MLDSQKAKTQQRRL